jgi:uncharacterized protein YdaL
MGTGAPGQAATGSGYSRRTFLKTTAVATAAAGLGLLGEGSRGWDLGLLDLGGRTANAATGQALVLYDGTGPWAWLGNVHSKLLANLLGRFLPAGQSINGTARKTVAEYTAGEIESYDAIFYLGHTYDNPLPAAFKADVMATGKPVLWFNYNIWQMAWGETGTAFSQRFGFTFSGLAGSSENPYNAVRYKGISYGKNPMDPQIGVTMVTDPQKAQVLATAVDGAGQEVPYIVRGGNLWYVGDLPFTYMAEEDRYLVLADILFDVMQSSHAQSKRALIRLEDVSAMSEPDDIRAVADYLGGQGVPFSIGVVPIYKDPHGHYNGGSPVHLPIHKATAVVEALHYALSRGGEIFMHGTTHQYKDLANPYNAVTGDDFEFYRAVENPDHTLTYVGPVPDDSPRWVRDTLKDGLREMSRAKLPIVGFEAPHYAASAVDYEAFAEMFGLTYHRALYFQDASVVIRTAQQSPSTLQATEEKKHGRSKEEADRRGRGKGKKNRTTDAQALQTAAVESDLQADLVAGQFFPFVVLRDVYGQKILPENLGNIEPVAWPDPVIGPYPKRLPEDVIRAASKNLGLRDAWASFYFHPFLDIQFLVDTVEGIRGLGYEFVRASSVTV